MGKCLFLRKGEIHTEPLTLKPDFADNTWEQIIEACQKNLVPDTWEIGDQKAMTIGDVDYMIDIIGKNHDTYSDDSRIAPLTFQIHDIYSNPNVDSGKYAMNNTHTNVGGWANCFMRKSYLPSILSLMPIEVQLGIKSVCKSASVGNMSTVIETVNDKLFLLSEIEVYGSVSGSANNEGRQYEYYSYGNSKIKRNSSGYALSWWLRSPYIMSSLGFCSVDMSGKMMAYAAASGYNISFAFCF